MTGQTSLRSLIALQVGIWTSLFLGMFILGSVVSLKAEKEVTATKILVTESGKAPLWHRVRHIASFGLIQSSTTVQANVPFDVVFDHAGVDTEGYRLYVGGSVLKTITLAQAALTNGTGKFTGVVLSAGAYNLTATAFNSAQESDPSNSLTVSAIAPPPPQGKPAPPTNVRKGGQ